MTLQQKIRVLCVDDHAFLVEGLKTRLAMEPDMECVGRLPTATDLAREVERLKPDVVLLDIEMPGTDPFEATDDLRRRFPDTRVVILSAHVRDHYLSAAFKAGAWGYFSKSDDVDAIMDGIRRVLLSEFALGPKVAERCRPPTVRGDPAPAAAPASRLDQLTPREQEVLRMIGRGLTRADIAKAICRSPKTVDGHRERIMAKLDIHSGSELVRFAIREGFAEA